MTRDPVIACRFEDDDPMVRACAPEQPETVAERQEWMEIATGSVLPVKRVRDGYIDLGSDSYTLVLSPESLRAGWVCTDLPPLTPATEINVDDWVRDVREQTAELQNLTRRAENDHSESL